MCVSKCGQACPVCTDGACIFQWHMSVYFCLCACVTGGPGRGGVCDGYAPYPMSTPGRPGYTVYPHTAHRQCVTGRRGSATENTAYRIPSYAHTGRARVCDGERNEERGYRMCTWDAGWGRDTGCEQGRDSDMIQGRDSDMTRGRDSDMTRGCEGGVPRTGDVTGDVQHRARRAGPRLEHDSSRR